MITSKQVQDACRGPITYSKSKMVSIGNILWNLSQIELVMNKIAIGYSPLAKVGFLLWNSRHKLNIYNLGSVSSMTCLYIVWSHNRQSELVYWNPNNFNVIPAPPPPILYLTSCCQLINCWTKYPTKNQLHLTVSLGPVEYMSLYAFHLGQVPLTWKWPWQSTWHMCRNLNPGWKSWKWTAPSVFLGGGGASEKKYIIFKENNDNPYENYNN